MKFAITPNGNLMIQAYAEDMDMLADLKRRCGEKDDMFLSELLEETGWSANGRLYKVEPIDVGALTEAPLLTNDLVVEDNGDVLVTGAVWWFQDYMIENFADRLIKNGQVLFALGSPALEPA